ncbi:zinc metalloprotease HtpX [bacterium]|nr:MAG: zinc metalloprotease HtpX [bacterium]
MLIFLVFVIGIGYIFSYSLDSPIILYIAVIVSIVMSFSSYWYSDKIVAKLAGAREVKFEDNKELYRILENLCITAGLPMPRIYLINEVQPNAFATGRNEKHAVVAVTTGLLEKLDRSEIEGVLAHELSHIGNKDMLLMTVTVVLAGTIALMSDFFIRIRWFGGGKKRGSGGGQVQAIIMIIALATAILAPIAASLIRMTISRKREFLADATGALITRYPEGLASALEKISSDPSPMKSAKNATAHLYIANPFREKQKKNWLTKMFMTHPPIEERIARLRGMKT